MWESASSVPLLCSRKLAEKREKGREFHNYSWRSAYGITWSTVIERRWHFWLALLSRLHMEFKWDAHAGFFWRSLLQPGLPLQYTTADTQRVSWIQLKGLYRVYQKFFKFENFRHLCAIWYRAASPTHSSSSRYRCSRCKH